MTGVCDNAAKAISQIILVNTLIQDVIVLITPVPPIDRCPDQEFAIIIAGRSIQRPERRGNRSSERSGRLVECWTD